MVVLVLLDLCAAFDTVNNRVLLLLLQYSSDYPKSDISGVENLMVALQ